MRIITTLEHHGRNPHDIGRRILRIPNSATEFGIIVAILMTLEGEYYMTYLLLSMIKARVAILMTLEGEYYRKSNF